MKVFLSAADLLESSAGLSMASEFLSTHSVSRTLDLLSKVALILSQAPHSETMETQRYLAPQFFSRGILERADAWIRSHRADGEAYLFSEQQLLMAMSLTLTAHRIWRKPLPKDPPYEAIGLGLLYAP